MIRILSNTADFHCITNIQDKAMREQMESMMGGYGIRRKSGYAYNNYSGHSNSLEWFKSIFRMYGFKVEVTENKLKSIK